jgi:EmrB/QacA subfamily drug resistance transporter
VTVAAQPTKEEATTHLRVWTFLLVSFGLFMVTLDNLVVSTALNVIRIDLHATLAQLEWIINAYTLVFAVFLITGAALGDRFGRKRMFIIGLIIFTAASAGAALSSDAGFLVAARAVQGIGGAIIMPLSLVLLSEAFPEERRGAVLGAWSGIAGLGVAVGPLVGGAIVDGLAWQWIFWVNVPVGIALIPLARAKLTESFGPSDRLDPIGLVLGSAGLFGIVWALVRAPSHGWTSAEILVTIIGGSAVLLAFIQWERRAPAPMLPMRFYRNRTFASTQVVSLLMYFGLFGVVFLMAQFLQAAQGYSPFQAGLRTLPWTGVPMFVAPFAGALAERIGGGRIMAVGMAFLAGGFAYLAAVLSPDISYGKMVPGLVLSGIGMGLYFAPVAHTILSSVRREEAGQASGAHSATREIGGVFGVAVLATIFASYGGYGTPQTFTDGIIPALWAGAAIVGCGAFAALLIPKPTHPPADAAVVAEPVAAGPS